MSRADVVDGALALVGLTSPDPAYLALVAPEEVAAGDLARAAEIARESDCERVWEGLARALWSLPPAEAYRDGQAFGNAYSLAGGPGASPWKPAGAIRIPTRESPPQVADGLVWGASAGAVAHVDAAVVELEIDGDVCTGSVVAGGQRVTAQDIAEGRAPPGTLGAETVKRLARTIRYQPGKGWVDTANARVLIAVFDADRMSVRYP